jgi:ribokinase
MLIVFGSLCTDFFLNIETHPTDRNPVSADMYKMYPGGRGGNQALAAARMGAKTAIVGMIGDDPMGTKLADKLRSEGVLTSGVGRSEKPTGCNCVAIDADDNPRIYQAMGANQDASADQIPDEILNEASMLVLQMELPEEENYKLMQRAKENGAKIMLNLAPMKMIPRKFLSMIDYLVVNQLEAKQIAVATDMDRKNNAVMIAKGLAQEGALTCIVTLGEKGSVAVTADGKSWGMGAMKIDDNISQEKLWGASDAYCGTFASCLYQDMPIEDALKRASIAASLACRGAGAQPSFPYSDDIEQQLADMPDAEPTQV